VNTMDETTHTRNGMWSTDALRSAGLQPYNHRRCFIRGRHASPERRKLARASNPVYVASVQLYNVLDFLQ
jgi:hypothetical protein